MIRTLIPAPVRRKLKRGGRLVVARLLRARSGQRVLSGPFRGMRMPSQFPGGTEGRFLLGTHELELHPALERLAASGLRTIVNCGAAFGYYAVGLAFRCTGARVIAFEADETWHPYLLRAAEANGVADRLTLRGVCTAAVLREVVRAGAPPAFVLADIDGGEKAVFDRGTVAALARATVLIETHDTRAPGTTDELRARFAPTHQLEVYLPRERTPADIPAAVATGPWRALAPLLLWEMREGRAADQQWLLFRPNQ